MQFVYLQLGRLLERVYCLNIKKHVKLLYIFLIGILNFALFQNCSPRHKGYESAFYAGAKLDLAFSGYTYVSGSDLEKSAMAIISKNCLSCHGFSASGGITHLENIDYMVSAGYILPGNNLGSKIYDSVSKGRMPKSNTLSASDIKTIGDWILAMQATPTDGSVVPLPSIIPLPTPLVDVTFVSNSPEELAAITILKNKCANCHDGGVASGNIGQITNVDYLVVSGQIFPGLSEQSPLFASISAGRMPLSRKPMTVTEIAAIKSWIENMSTVAMAGNNVPLPTPLPALEPTFKSISANILQPKCVYCHGPIKSEESLHYETYLGTMKSVKPKVPTSSKLYTECKNGKMPEPPGTISPAQISVIKDWITNGALDN